MKNFASIVSLISMSVAISACSSLKQGAINRDIVYHKTTEEVSKNASNKETKVNEAPQESKINANNATKNNVSEVKNDNIFVSTQINFTSKSEDLNEISKNELKKISKNVKSLSEKEMALHKVKLSAYGDPNSSKEVQKKLANKRANSITTYLLKEGLAKDMLVTEINFYPTNHKLSETELVKMRKVSLQLVEASTATKTSVKQASKVATSKSKPSIKKDTTTVTEPVKDKK